MKRLQSDGGNDAAPMTTAAMAWLCNTKHSLSPRLPTLADGQRTGTLASIRGGALLAVRVVARCWKQLGGQCDAVLQKALK
jgi:hypothetical protein